MMEYSKNKISLQELHTIFKSNIDRSIFITDYPYLDDDGNRDFYIDFINKNIDCEYYKRQEAAIELSIAIQYFKTSYLEVISSIIYSRRGYWIKLLCLDWLANFSNEIPLNTFFELNEHLIKKNNERLKMQGILNILSLKADDLLVGKLIKLLNKTTDHIVFYRLANFNHATKTIPKDMIKEICDIINKNGSLTFSQKSELTERLSFENLLD